MQLDLTLNPSELYESMNKFTPKSQTLIRHFYALFYLVITHFYSDKNISESHPPHIVNRR